MSRTKGNGYEENGFIDGVAGFDGTGRLLEVRRSPGGIGGGGTGGTAHADNGPHGAFGPTPDGCASCHRIHTASAPGLLTDATLGICLNCHNGSGADTDVVDGLFLGLPNRGLKAGGVTNALMDTD